MNEYFTTLITRCIDSVRIVLQLIFIIILNGQYKLTQCICIFCFKVNKHWFFHTKTEKNCFNFLWMHTNFIWGEIRLKSEQIHVISNQSNRVPEHWIDECMEWGTGAVYSNIVCSIVEVSHSSFSYKCKHRQNLWF